MSISAEKNELTWSSTFIELCKIYVLFKVEPANRHKGPGTNDHEIGACILSIRGFFAPITSMRPRFRVTGAF